MWNLHRRSPHSTATTNLMPGQVNSLSEPPPQNQPSSFQAKFLILWKRRVFDHRNEPPLWFLRQRVVDGDRDWTLEYQHGSSAIANYFLILKLSFNVKRYPCQCLLDTFPRSPKMPHSCPRARLSSLPSPPPFFWNQLHWLGAFPRLQHIWRFCFISFESFHIRILTIPASLSTHFI